MHKGPKPPILIRETATITPNLTKTIKGIKAIRFKTTSNINPRSRGTVHILRRSLNRRASTTSSPRTSSPPTIPQSMRRNLPRTTDRATKAFHLKRNSTRLP